MNTFKSILLFVLGAATVTTIFVLSSYTGPEDGGKGDETPQAAPTTDQVQNIHIPEIPEKINFAGEAVPVDEMDMRERFDRELLSICFWHSSTISNIKLANRYFPLIEEILKREGVPDDFKYLAVTESSLRNATSPAGAKGIWQFMSSTGKSYGLLINSEVDERLNFYKTTEAACKLLKRLKQKFGSWTLAAAAYNCGEGRVTERMTKQGGKDYYDLVLPDETMRYVPRILAMKQVLSDPAAYGFNFKDEDFYPEFPRYKRVPVNGSIASWPGFCKQHNISYRELTLHNPWIKAYTLTNPVGKKYEVLIPEG